ncbi:DUF4365 domain-containing protein [Pseudomonas paraversuta]|uniref:DUF4365 domain-containing protein n=1 Tax=Pseudomonas paraversuta TaxID=2750624 RepID=UPI001931C76F|nr:DUF4365 domain-containing protein [Pseudomonas paraversuta]
MDAGKKKEQFNIAYLHAMAAQAGLNPSQLMVDDDSIDIQLSGKGFTGMLRNPMVQLQLKCTSQNLVSGNVIKFPLSRKNFDDLRGGNVICPRYLVVLLIPEDDELWVKHHSSHMALHNICYWLSLRDFPNTNNISSVTVEIPLSQRLTTTSLRHLLTLASDGESA